MISSKWPPLRTEQSPSQHWLFCYCHADGSSSRHVLNNIMTQNAVEYLLVNCYWKKGKQLSWELFVNTTATNRNNKYHQKRSSCSTHNIFQCENNSRDLHGWTVIFVISKKRGCSFVCFGISEIRKTPSYFLRDVYAEMRVRRRDCFFFLACQKNNTCVCTSAKGIFISIDCSTWRKIDQKALEN